MLGGSVKSGSQAVSFYVESDFSRFISNLVLLAEIGFLSEQGQFNCNKVRWWQACICFFYGKLMFIIQWNYIVTNITLSTLSQNTPWCCLSRHNSRLVFEWKFNFSVCIVPGNYPQGYQGWRQWNSQLGPQKLLEKLGSRSFCPMPMPFGSAPQWEGLAHSKSQKSWLGQGQWLRE